MVSFTVRQLNNDKKEKSCTALFPDRTLKALSKIIQQTPKPVALVLSSTWRVRPEFCHQILQAFQTYNNVFRGFLPTTFYDVTDVVNHTERQWEIYDWLKGQDQKIKTPRIGLDDEELLEEQKNAKYQKLFEGHVIKDSISSCGLTMKEAELAIRLLKQQVACQQKS
jgi:hypothetical protein